MTEKELPYLLNTNPAAKLTRAAKSDRIQLLTVENFNERRIPINVWAILIFLTYVIIGIAFYSFGPSQLSALDSVYLAVITFSTVGYGDIKINSRYFACFYVLLGVALVGTFFGILWSDILDYQEELMQKRLLYVAKRIDKMFIRSAKQFDDYRRNKVNKLFGGVTPSNVAEEVVSEFKKANLEVFEEELSEIRSKGVVDFFFILVAIFSGCVAMMAIEGWVFEQGLYWAIVTVTTVGYGDVTPDTDGGKVFTIFYVLVGCSLAAKGFRDFFCYPLVVRAKETEMKIIEQFGEELSERTLKSILNSDLLRKIPHLQQDSKALTKSEFVVLVLRLMNKVQEKDVILASEIFDRLDAGQDGILSEQDQKEQIALARARDRERNIELQRRLAEEQLAQQQKGNITDVFTNLLSPLAGVGMIFHHEETGEEVSNPIFLGRRKSSRVEEQVDESDGPEQRHVTDKSSPHVKWVKPKSYSSVNPQDDDYDHLDDDETL